MSANFGLLAGLNPDALSEGLDRRHENSDSITTTWRNFAFVDYDAVPMLAAYEIALVSPAYSL